MRYLQGRFMPRLGRSYRRQIRGNGLFSSFKNIYDKFTNPQKLIKSGIKMIPKQVVSTVMDKLPIGDGLTPPMAGNGLTFPSTVMQPRGNSVLTQKNRKLLNNMLGPKKLKIKSKKGKGVKNISR